MKFIKKQPFVDYCWRLGWRFGRNVNNNQQKVVF